MKYSMLVLLLFGIGCAKKGDSAAAAADKDLFSSWYNVQYDRTVNATGATFGASTWRWTFSNGTICDVTMTITGSQASGTYAISNPTYVSGSGASLCPTLTSSGTYTKSGSVLSTCSNNVCLVYQ